MVSSKDRFGRVRSLVGSALVSIDNPLRSGGEVGSLLGRVGFVASPLLGFGLGEAKWRASIRFLRSNSCCFSSSSFRLIGGAKKGAGFCNDFLSFSTRLVSIVSKVCCRFCTSLLVSSRLTSIPSISHALS